MKATITATALLLVFLTVVSGDRIFPWGDPYIKYPNKGLISTMQLFFSLETKLPAGHVMRIRFPFTTAPNLGLVVVHSQTSSRGTVSTPATGTIAATQFGSRSTTPFDVYYTFASELLAGTNYVLGISFATSPSDVGWLGYVQLETMSPAASLASVSLTDVPITYDQNNAFAPIHIFDQPGTPTFSLGNTETTATPTVAAATYVQPLKLQLSNNFWFWPTIVISWSGSAGFSFGQCVSADTGLATTATPLPASQYTCTISSTDQTITINHNAPVLMTQNLVYNVSITNPKDGGSTSLSVMAYHRYNFNVTDNNLNAITITVNPPTTTIPATPPPALSGVQALLSWGIDRKNSVNSVLQGVFQIYGSSLADGSAIFQGIRFVFGVSGTMAPGTYKLVLNVCSSASNCQILENSIDHNLGSSVVCSSGADATSGYIQVSCPGVTSLQSSGNYIGVRAQFDRTTAITGTAIDSQFGQITVYTQPATGNPTTYLSPIALDTAYKVAKASQTAALTLLGNLNGNGPLFGTTDANAWGAVTTAGSTAYTTLGTFAPLHGGLFVSTSATPPAMNLALFTSIDGAATTYPNSANAFGNIIATSKTSAGSGVDLFLNPNLWSVVSSVDKSGCYAENVAKKTASAHTTTTGAHCYSAANSSTTNWVRLRFIFTALYATANVDSATAGLLMTFFWPGFVQQKSQYSGTSLKADVNVPDYYAAFYWANVVTGIANTTSGASVSDIGDLGGATLTTTLVPGAINSVVWSQYFLAPFSVSATPAITSLYGSMKVWLSSFSNNGTSPSWTTNDAITIIRARGQLVTTDPSPSSAKLALFFSPPATSALTAGYLPVGPAGTTATANTFVCFTSTAGNKCSNDRSARIQTATVTLATNAIGKAVSALSRYQIISTDAVFTNTSSQTLSILTDFFHIAAGSFAADAITPRFGWLVSSGYYYINPEDNSYANTGAGSAVTATGTAPSCDGSTTVPNIGPLVAQTGQVVNQNNSLTQINFKVTTTAVVPSAGRGNIIWCARWNFQTTGFGFVTTTTSGLESSSPIDRCVAFNYQSIASTKINHYCFYCPISASATNAPSTTSRFFNVSGFLNANAQTILQPSWGLVSNDDGILQEKATCATWINAFTPGLASGSSTGSAFGQLGQKVVISVTLGSTISGIDTIIIEGRNYSAPASSDTNFPQSSMDSNAECWLVSTSDSSISNYLSITCPSAPSGTLTFSGLSVASPKDTQSSWQIIVWGLSGNTAPSPPPTSLYFMIKSQRSSSIVDQSVTTLASNLVPWPILPSTTNFTIQSPTYTRGILNSRGSFRWDFSLPSTRPVYYKDNIVFYLDAISTSSQNANANILKCRITDSTGVVNQNFRSCTFSSTTSPASLTIVTLQRGSFAVFDFAMNGVRVMLDGVQAIALQTIKTVSGKVFFGGVSGGTTVSLTKDNTATDLVVPSDQTTKAFPSSYPAITKYWAAPGSFGDIAFTLISSVQFNETCRITIEFPTYYNPGLTTRSQVLFCSVDGVSTNCQVSGPRTLQIDGFPSAKSANTAFTVRVSGISAPSITTADNFWIQLNQDLSDSATTVIYAGSISETIVPSATITPFHVNWMNVTTANTRSTTTFTWTCNPIGAQNYTTNHSVHILFPPSWGLAWGVFTPTCQIIDYATPSTIYSAPQTIMGDNVYLNLQATLLQKQIVNIACQNIRTPDSDPSYASQDIQIRIVDQNGSTIFQHSAPSVHNLNFGYQFLKSTTLSYVNWDTTTSSSITSPISIPRGTFGTQLILNMPARSVRTFQVAVTPSTFAFWPTPFNVTTGQTSSKTFIGCSQGTAVNRYALLFTLSDSSSYTAPPVAYVKVTMSKVNIAVTSGPIAVLYVQGTSTRSYPVTFDSSATPPFSDITVTPTPPTNANFTVTPSAVTLTPSNPWGSVVFATTSNTVSGESDSYSFALSGTNANAFNSPANLLVTATPDTTNQATVTPTLTITLDGSDQGKATTKVLSLNLGTGVSIATAYYGCQLAGTWTLGQNGLMAAANQQLQFNPLDPVLGQYFSVVLTKSQQAVVVSNLRPNTFYECQGFAVSQTNRTSVPMAAYSFKTASNGGSIVRWLFNHTAWPTSTQRQRLLCVLTQTLSVPAVKIVAITGEICGNTTQFYTTANATGDLAVYFYPLDVEIDSVMTQANLQSTLNTTANFQALNNTVVTGDQGAAIFSLIPDGTVAVNQLSPTFPSSANVGLNWAAVSGISLNDTGFIFAALASNTSTSPTGISLKLAAASNSSSYIGGVQVGYYSLSTGPVTYNFSGLQPATSYTIYLVGTNNDPTYSCNFTSVSAIPVTTQAIPTTPVSAIALFTSMLAIVVSILALQVF